LYGEDFEDWLAQRYHDIIGDYPKSAAIKNVQRNMRFKAKGMPPQEVFLRVGWHNVTHYLDLADSEGRVIETDADGSRVITNPPLRFRRSPTMLPLPVPDFRGSIDPLREFVNVGSDTDFVLLIAFALAALWGKGEFPVLAFMGEQGSGKSAISSTIKQLIDPDTAPISDMPSETRDLWVAAHNSHVLAFDNLHSLTPKMSNTICQISTGSALRKRTNFSMLDETKASLCRPQIYNGIDDFVRRGDLVERTIMITPPPIPKSKRLPQDDIEAKFNTARPAILGGLLNAISTGIRNLPDTTMQFPRMASFARRIVASETALWPPGTFMADFDRNLEAATEKQIQDEPLVEAVVQFMKRRANWQGEPMQLLGLLVKQIGGDAVARSFGKSKWPTVPNVLTYRLGTDRRIVPLLRKGGIEARTGQHNLARRAVELINHSLESKAPPPPLSERKRKKAKSVESAKRNRKHIKRRKPAPKATRKRSKAKPKRKVKG
jgi:hypothetical protein